MYGMKLCSLALDVAQHRQNHQKSLQNGILHFVFRKNQLSEIKNKRKPDFSKKEALYFKG